MGKGKALNPAWYQHLGDGMYRVHGFRRSALTGKYMPQDVPTPKEETMPEINEINHIKLEDWAGDKLAAYFDDDGQQIVFTIEGLDGPSSESIELTLEDSVKLATWILAKA